MLRASPRERQSVEAGRLIVAGQEQPKTPVTDEPSARRLCAELGRVQPSANKALRELRASVWQRLL